jgi:hypothetical protein
MVVLARAIVGHARHDLRRHILHVFADQVGDMPARPVGC